MLSHWVTFFLPSDDHDVLSFLLFRLTEPGQQPVTTSILCVCVCAESPLSSALKAFFLSFQLKPPAESEIPKEEKDKYQEEFQNFQQELDKKKEEFQKEHPDVQGEPSQWRDLCWSKIVEFCLSVSPHTQ